MIELESISIPEMEKSRGGEGRKGGREERKKEKERKETEREIDVSFK